VDSFSLRIPRAARREGSRETAGAALTLRDALDGAPPRAPAAARGALRRPERIFLRLERTLGTILPESLNPLLHTGAIAIVCIFVATATGFILLTWYEPSIAMARESVEAMSNTRFPQGFHRSLHRYSSDAALLFGAIHALRSFVTGRFGGARWLAWVTGGIVMLLVWAIGWTGYWLVWDMRAQRVAVATIELMNAFPFFGDPVHRSVLPDEDGKSFLLFVVFFFHMLVPLALGIVAWLHITRLSRPRFVTDRPMTLWLLGMLFTLCVAYPATNAGPAGTTGVGSELTMDWWYLWPLAFVERLDGDVLWIIAGVSGAIFFSVLWWLAPRRPEPAAVVASRCNECTLCYKDCPYEAIKMVSRKDGHSSYKTQASVIASKCVSCGICVGACETVAIGVPSFDSTAQRVRIDSWLAEALAQGETPHVGFICAESAGAELEVDPATGISPELPGYRLLQVPCAGWVHPTMTVRALRNGAAGALIVSCGLAACLYREGALWTEQRAAGEREPSLHSYPVPPQKVAMLGLDRTRKAELIDRAAALRVDGRIPLREAPRPALGLVAAALLALVFAALIGTVSDLGY